ncbi:flagellar hook-length control protein FliK [Schwartzia succinivorans]|jgi:flagellar hook-length control protein FliK|nr:flagellar hook-length control protein FliK [Schwartzia succinivorans]
MKATEVMVNLGSSGAPQAGAGAKLSAASRQVTAAKSAQTKNGADSFERSLDEAQAGRAQEPKAKTETKDNTSAKADNKNVRDDVKDTPKETAKDTKSAEDAAKAAAEAAASEGAKDTPKTEGKGNAESAGKDSDVKEAAGMQEDTETVKATTLDAMLASLAGAAAAVGEKSADIEAQPAAEEKPQLGQSAMKLENLLPQTEEGAEKAAQNGKLMDMLNSVPTNASLKAAPELTELAQKALSAQQNTEGNTTAEAPAVMVQPGTAAALGDAAASALNENAPAVAVQQNAVQQGAFQTALSAQQTKPAEGAETKTQSAAEALFGAAQVVVEDRISLPNANNSAQQQLQDFLKRQGQPQQQNEAEDGGAVIKQGTQLPENADFDVAMVTKEPAQQPLAGAQNIMNTMGVQQTAAVQQLDEAQQVRDPYNVMQQIVDQAKLIRSGEDTEMVIQLNPKHLGELTLRVSVSTNGAVNASFHTDNPTVRGLIESSMIQLKQELQAQGIKVNNVEVYSGLSQDFFAGSQAGQQGLYQQEARNAQSNTLRAAAFEDDAEALSITAAAPATAGENTPSIGTANGVDYKV